MAHTNSTPNYNLPQFLGTDKPAWLTDINNAMSDIDTAIAAAKTTADSADTAVSALAITVGNHTSQLSTLSGAVTSQGNTLNTVTSLIGNGTPTTTDQTIIGAINELAAIVEAGDVSVTANGVKTWKQLLEELFAAVDVSKVSERSNLLVTSGGNVTCYSALSVSATSLQFYNVHVGGGNIILEVIQAASSSNYSQKTEGQTISYLNTNVPTSGIEIKIVY